MREIRIYVEGGGDDSDSLARMRHGFGAFLGVLRDCARRKGIRWGITACGGRDQAYDDFVVGLRNLPAMFHVLLVDSEAPVMAATAWQHLRQRDSWVRPVVAADDQCHLMVQAMESWLLADRAALARFYGQRFNANALPRTAQIEVFEKARLERAMEQATRRTTKGSYHKILQGAELLRLIDPAKVRAASPHCAAMFAALAARLGGG